MAKIEYSYACPNCGSIHLQVSVTARAALTQDEEDGNLQTWVFGDHEWDNDSPMECSDCQYSGSARHFIVPHRLRLYERLAQNTQFQKLLPPEDQCVRKGPCRMVRLSGASEIRT